MLTHTHTHTHIHNTHTHTCMNILTNTYTDKSVFKIKITYGPESYNYQMIPIKYQSNTFK